MSENNLTKPLLCEAYDAVLMATVNIPLSGKVEIRQTVTEVLYFLE